MKTGLFVLSAIFLAACSKSSNNNPMTTNTADSAAVSFASQVQPIFTSNCALSGCHAGSGARQGMDLSSGNAYNNIVNKKSTEVSAFYLVDPSKSDSSYLYMKIMGASGTAGARMPYLRGALASADIEMIKSWIDQGAKNN
jgi:hypothetical protein